LSYPAFANSPLEHAPAACDTQTSQRPNQAIGGGIGRG
jgi:hypothetical protein